MSWVEASLNLMDLTDSTVSEIQPMDDTCAIEIRMSLSSFKKTLTFSSKFIGVMWIAVFEFWCFRK